MSVPIPKITYAPVGGGSVTLAFTYPPVQKGGPHDGTSDTREAQRVDSLTLSGKKQSIYLRTDIIRPLNMANVPMIDLPAWSAFIDYALTGGTFNYYPDATVNSFTTYTLDDTNWTPQYVSVGLAKFTLKMRLWV